jgi:hypothetical protein
MYSNKGCERCCTWGTQEEITARAVYLADLPSRIQHIREAMVWSLSLIDSILPKLIFKMGNKGFLHLYPDTLNMLDALRDGTKAVEKAQPRTARRYQPGWWDLFIDRIFKGARQRCRVCNRLLIRIRTAYMFDRYGKIMQCPVHGEEYYWPEILSSD